MRLPKVVAAPAGLRRQPPARSGAVIVETAFIMLLFFVVIFAILEYGRYIMIRQLVENAAREGARVAVVNTVTQNETLVRDTITFKLANQVPSPTVTIEKVDPTTGVKVLNSQWYEAGFGDAIAVKITATFSPLFPLYNFTGNGNITAVSVMRAEG